MIKHQPMTPELYAYMEDISLREHPALQALREATADMPLAMMQSAPVQAQFLQFLVRLNACKRVLEIGTYTGYTTLALALALPDDGSIVTCDINPEWTKHGLPFWQQAKQTHKINLRLAPALETLDALLTEAKAQFDFIFIDADKTNYVPYYERALQLIRQDGIIAIDNIFWDGHVIDSSDTSAQTREIRRLNQLIKEDTRVNVSLLPIGDGLFLCSLR